MEIPSRADDSEFGRDGLPTPRERVRRRAVYERMLPRLELLAWQHGYTLARHGSMTRDCDLVAAPWIAAAADPNHLVRALTEEIGGWYRSPSLRPHGRLAWSIHFSTFENAHLYFDVSVMPRAG